MNLSELIQLHSQTLEKTDNTIVLSEPEINTLLIDGEKSLEDGVVNFTKVLNNESVDLFKYPIVKNTLLKYQDTLRLIRTMTSYILFDQGYLALSDTSFAKLDTSKKPSLEQIEPLFNLAKSNYNE